MTTYPWPALAAWNERLAPLRTRPATPTPAPTRYPYLPAIDGRRKGDAK